MKKKNRVKKIAILLLAFTMVACSVFLTGCGIQPNGNDVVRGFYSPVSSAYSAQWTGGTSNVTQLNESTVSGIRDRFTKIQGNGKDTVTVMVYMCGTDLESQGAMGSYDLQEMAKANISEKVNVIVFTGGCSSWHIDGISNKYNEIFRVIGNGQMECLTDNAGTAPMTDPDNLTSFIEFCKEHFEADRYELIFWDHGSGTVGGYGHDEKYPNSGSMTLDKIDRALTNSDTQFDFVGFDACLMATTETALMLSEHADYMFGSEEAEPGIGWYYTDWLNALSENTSISTVQLGKILADSFVKKCSSDVPQQAATLSVIDLAEVQATIPSKLSAFAKSTMGMIQNGEYKTVAQARGSSRDFGASSQVDMVDLVDLASKFTTKEAADLKDALLSCIKYNNTSRSMTNSYGLSIFFPYRSTKYVNTVLKTYKNIQMDSDYSECIKSFASYQASGQMSSGGSHSAYQGFSTQSGNPHSGNYGHGSSGTSGSSGSGSTGSGYTISDIFGDYGSGYGGSYYPSSQDFDYELLFNLLSLFATGGYTDDSSYSGYYSSGWDSLLGDSGWTSGWDEGTWGRSMINYIVDNHFTADLTWKDGKVYLTQEQWDMVSDLKFNLFLDDGEGYIDLGKDNIYEIDDEGNLLKQEDMTWIAASSDQEHWQVVPYYYLSTQETEDDVVYSGRIPVLYNGKQADLMVQMDSDSMEVVGVSFNYEDGAMAAKNMTGLKAGDELRFICDYYDYDGNYNDSYILGDPLYVGSVDRTVLKGSGDGASEGETITITDPETASAGTIYLGDVDISTYDTIATYEFVDIYQQSFWTDEMK